MFDEKWMKGKEDKPIETIEDAMMVMIAHNFCSGVNCKDCFMHQYNHENNNCGATRNKALEFIYKHFGMEVKKGDRGLAGQEKVYKALFENGCLGKLSGKKEEPKRSGNGTCEGCYFSKMHTSGIRWCEKFHNFVHEDGYCYRFRTSDTMEEMGR